MIIQGCFTRVSSTEERRVNAIINAQWEWVNKPKEVIEAFLQFYKDLLGSSGHTRQVEQKIIEKGRFL